jgi:TIR domain-containing protein
MTARLLNQIEISHGSGVRRIQLFVGDLSRLPSSLRVDALVVSAFPDDYLPTPASLIGALFARGVSVAELAARKATDLRETCSCWMSPPLSAEQAKLGFDRILCFEPATRGAPTEVVGDIFRALIPFLGDHGLRSVAMPVVATGDQRTPLDEMLPALMEAALHWMSLGISLETLRIFVNSEDSADEANRIFERAKGNQGGVPIRHDAQYDVFISYAHEDAEDVRHVEERLAEAVPELRVFIDRQDLSAGAAWQARIFEAIDRSRALLAFLSPAYLQSAVCKEEFNIAWARGRDLGEDIVYPVYLYTAELPTYMRLRQYVDCREGARPKLTAAADQLIDRLRAQPPA